MDSDRFYWTDLLVLSAIAILLTAHPFYLYGQINLFELGLYLPGIDAVLHGQVPFRDFFYLRGPFELYVPAFLMQVFGTQTAVLATYFYVGTVLTLIVCAWIARELYPNRAFVYIMTVVLAMRTFPRVVFTYWGGMRYVWGLLAVLCVIKFFKTRRHGWICAAGILSAVSFWTSIEIGVSTFIAAAVALAAAAVFSKGMSRALLWYAIGAAAVFLPYMVYLVFNQALLPMAQTIWQVTTTMAQTFPQTEKVPESLVQVLAALFNPGDKNFRQMTPVFGYVAAMIYLFFRHRRRELDAIDLGLLVLAAYGFMLYVTAFRNLWASQFEMALQPWKIVQFFLLARVFMVIQENKRLPYQRMLAGVVLAAVIISSGIYVWGRYKKRYWPVLKAPVTDTFKAVPVERLQGMKMPQRQAEDLAQLDDFLRKNTKPGEKVFMYPEMGAVHFMVDRPWAGRFPTATMAWFSDSWYDEWLAGINAAKPAVAVVLKEVPMYFHASYLSVEANRRKFTDTMDFIKEHYRPVAETPSWQIYRLKELP